jgi:hypothetical protein
LETKGDNPQEMWKLLRKASEYSSNNKIDAKFDPNDSMKHFQTSYCFDKEWTAAFENFIQNKIWSTGLSCF